MKMGGLAWKRAAMNDDRALVTRIAQGDEHALHTLYLTYRPRLYRYLWHQLRGDEQTVADLLQEVFLAIWRTAAQFRGDAQVATWIFQLAHNHVVRVRSRAHHSADMPLDDMSEQVQLVASAEDEVVGRLTLLDALKQMSPKQREVLELIYLQGFSLEEVARIVAVPVGTVKSRVNTARQHLFRALSLADVHEENHS